MVGSGRMPRRFQRVHRQVQADQVRQRQVRPLAQAHVGQIQLLDALQVVEQLFEVGPQRVVTLVPSMPKQQKKTTTTTKQMRNNAIQGSQTSTDLDLEREALLAPYKSSHRLGFFLLSIPFLLSFPFLLSIE